MAPSLGVYGDEISFTVAFDQLFWLRVLPGDTAKVESSKEDSGRLAGHMK